MGAPSLRTQATAVVAIFALLSVFLPTSPAVAGWLPTRVAAEGPRERILSILEREEVAAGLEKMGVDLQEARRRVAGMTEAEARLALDKLDSLPAAGDGGIGVIIGALLFVFIVLLITDILGLTRVFPFVKKTVR